MTLNHVALLGLVVVVAQCRLHGQVGHRRVADGVPALLDLDGAVVQLLDGGAANRQGAILLHLDGIRLLRRDGHAVGVARGNPLLLCCLVAHRQFAVQLSQDVAVAPAHAAQQLVHVAELLALQIERYPVPALLQLEVLDEVLAAVEAHGLVGTQHGILLERDGRRLQFPSNSRCQHNLTTRAVLPQAELQLAAAGLAVIDGQVQSRLRRLRVVRDVGKAVALVLVVEHTHDVARVAVQLVIEVHLSADVHRVRQELAVHVVGPFRLLALHRQVEVERLGDAFLVGQVDNLVVRTDIQVLAHRGGDVVQTLRSHHVAVLVECQPARAVLDGVGVALGAVVVER